MHEQLAIIRKPGVGARDFPGRWGVWFEIDLLDHSGALICLFGDEADTILKSVYDIKDLDGKPCVIETDGQRACFKRLHK